MPFTLKSEIRDWLKFRNLISSTVSTDPSYCSLRVATFWAIPPISKNGPDFPEPLPDMGIFTHHFVVPDLGQSSPTCSAPEIRYQRPAQNNLCLLCSPSVKVGTTIIIFTRLCPPRFPKREIDSPLFLAVLVPFRIGQRTQDRTGLGPRKSGQVAFPFFIRENRHRWFRHFGSRMRSSSQKRS